MTKRLLILAALAALLTMAVPALAQGAVWKKEGVNLTKFTELGLTGGELFETSSGNGMSCEIHATLTTEGGSTGKISKFEIKSCPTGFGTFSGCTVKTAEAKGLPWTVTVNATDLSITNMHIKRTFNGGCAEVDKTVTSTTVTLNTPSAITEVEWVSETTGYKSVGSATIDGTNSGKYGIG
ncbi:MAG TPA: hypothetical protein VMT37_12505 [Solirubrobacterales bacterium]|nr:hypothetical protein [Solirubrobacterales bacterium]